MHKELGKLSDQVAASEVCLLSPTMRHIIRFRIKLLTLSKIANYARMLSNRMNIRKLKNVFKRRWLPSAVSILS